MALTDCNLAHRDGRAGHAGNQHRHKGERRRLRSTKKKKVPGDISVKTLTLTSDLDVVTVWYRCVVQYTPSP